MAIFKRKHIAKILTGQKTQTRRTHKHTWQIGKVYGIRDTWYNKPQAHIKIIRKFKQKLGDISPEDIKKEGYKSLEEFRKAWEEINGGWDPNQTVTAYEFKLVFLSLPRLAGGRIPPAPGSGAQRDRQKGSEKHA
jgi:hypothetical protein